MSLELSAKVEDGSTLAPGRMTAWLDINYTNKQSKESYVVTLKNFIMFVYGKDSVSSYVGQRYGLDQISVKRNKEKRIKEIEEGLSRYFSDLDHRNFLDDYKGFIHWTRDEGYANLSIRGMCNKVKLFFGRQDKRCKIDDDDWAQMKRTLLPKSTRASTQDDILDKLQLKRVMRFTSIHGRSMALFLLSTGARVGESCKLKREDINLNDDPPYANIKEKYTKGEVGGRRVWFSYEARDAIREWHEVREFQKKSGDHGEYDKDLVFNYKPKGFQDHWNSCLVKADGGRKPPVLSRRDTSTKKKIYVYHVHTLRKFFRTNMGIEGSYEGKSGVPDFIVHGWMGHKGYLDEAYDRGLRWLAGIYKENMHVVTVYEAGITRESAAMKDAYIEELEAKIATLEKSQIDKDEMVKEVIDEVMKRVKQK